ncbi:MAG: 30S ribosome-binding factor RbfA [Synergistaceae bacterium]|jgi:ribosome-binding factor A|nr:30S ribosome-binding factor RbfA [Synergistaceae bacterium]
MAKINKQLQREISLLLEQRVKNDGAKNAIITGVDCARDLEFARVYFTTLDPATRTAVLADLQNVKGALRTMLGQVLKLRHIPALEFVVDQSPDYGQRIDAILHNLGLDAAKNDAGGQENQDQDQNQEEYDDEHGEEKYNLEEYNLEEHNSGERDEDGADAVKGRWGQ